MSDATAPGVIATSGLVRTMADDSLRLQLTIDPALAKLAFRLFRPRGTALAMAVMGKPDLPAVEGASAGMETMAKGVARLFVDVEPRHADRAIDLFGDAGVLMALAALTPEHLREREREKQQRLEARGHRPSFLAVQWCRDAVFREWLARCPELEESRAAVRPAAISAGQPTAPPDAYAALVLCHACGITSRRELDTDPDALSRFNRNVRRPFLAWQQAQAHQGATA